MVRNLNIGVFEVLPNNKSYSNLIDFIVEYPRDKVNKDGLRMANYKESNYLIKTFKELGLSEFLKKYYYTFVSDITIVYDPYGTGRYKEAIIDDPAEIFKFQNGEASMGYDSDGAEDEFWKGAGKIEDWREEKSVYFIIRPL